ncbi:MAG TPA: acyltransferase [Candidatus Bathyarchaeota archaeon]|nr:acyltransferase [Candidatus Bathyarchaeota archaeon]
MMSAGFLKFLIRYIKATLRNKYTLFQLLQRFPSLRVDGEIYVINPQRLYLGKNVLIQRGTILHCGGLAWSHHEGYIKIGDDSEISPYCVFYGAGGIEIGKRFDCGPGTMIFSSRSSYDVREMGQIPHKHRFGKVTIGDDVILFAGVIVSPGVTIGNGSVVGANSLVLKDIPPGEIWGGSPARFLKKRSYDPVELK